MIQNGYGGHDLHATLIEVEKRLDALEAVVFPMKSSGIDGDAGDWTTTGDGTNYPTEPVDGDPAS